MCFEFRKGALLLVIIHFYAYVDPTSNILWNRSRIICIPLHAVGVCVLNKTELHARHCCYIVLM